MLVGWSTIPSHNTNSLQWSQMSLSLLTQGNWAEGCSCTSDPSPASLDTVLSTGCTWEAPGRKDPAGVNGNTVLASNKLESPLPYGTNHREIIKTLLGYREQHQALQCYLWITATGLLCYFCNPAAFPVPFPPHLPPTKYFLYVLLKLPCPRNSLKRAHCSLHGSCLCHWLHSSKR